MQMETTRKPSVRNREALEGANKKPFSAARLIIYIFLVLLAVLDIAPLVWMVVVSLKTNAEVFSSPFAMPEVLQLGNYIFAWTSGKRGAGGRSAATMSGCPTGAPGRRGAAPVRRSARGWGSSDGWAAGRTPSTAWGRGTESAGCPVLCCRAAPAE